MTWRWFFLTCVFWFLAEWAACVVHDSGWRYGLVDGEIKRAWTVYLPGFNQYTEMAEPPVVQSYFSMRSPYRVGPWIDPEWKHE